MTYPSKFTSKISFFQNFSWFLLQSIFILWLKYKDFFYGRMDFDQKLQFGAAHPTFFWPPLKMAIFHVKSLKIEIFSIFQLYHLFSSKFSSYYHFLWFCRPFWPFFQGKVKNKNFIISGCFSRK